MSKTQKIILYIGVGLVGISLVLLLVNTVLKNRNQNKQPNTPNTNLFSLFEIPLVNPSKKTDEQNSPGTAVVDDTQNNNTVILASESKAISSKPVLDFYPVEKSFDQITFGSDQKTQVVKTKKQGVRYVDFEGLAYEFYDNEGEKLISKTITNRLGEAFIWRDNLVLRFSREDMQTIETFIGAISNKEPNIGDLVGSYMPKNARSFSINNETGRYVGLVADEARQGAQILIGTLGKSDRQVLLKTSFTDWLLDWADTKNLILTTRPAQEVMGYSYLVNIQTLAKTKIASGYGLNTKGLPFGAGILISHNTNQNFITELYLNQKLNFLPFKTVSDKCTASNKDVIVCGVPSGSIKSLDDWYRGEVNFNDKIISYNTTNGLQKILLDGVTIDVDLIKPSPDGSLIYFRNKYDGLVYKINTN